MKKGLKNKLSVTAMILKNGGTAVIPTDTLYGIIALAINKKAVQKVYKIKKRTPAKPSIILISSSQDLSLFGIALSSVQKNILKKLWPGKVSVIFSCSEKRFIYLHRSTNSLAFRIPKNKKLLSLLEKTGPLIAPSANPEGMTPARNITEAKKYFGDEVDAYVSGKNLSGKPSTLIKLNGDGSIVVLREGAKKIKVVSNR